MKDFLSPDEPLLSRIHALIKCLSKAKHRPYALEGDAVSACPA
jgi:hypothetical protein